MPGSWGWWAAALGLLMSSWAQAQPGASWQGITLDLGRPPAFAAVLLTPDEARPDVADQALSLTVTHRVTQLDWHPLGSSFRLSGGMRFAADRALLSDPQPPEAHPYFGLGWGEHWGERLSLQLDLGVMLPALDWSRNTDAALLSGGSSGFQLVRDRPGLSYAPLFQVGLGYSF